MQHEELAKQFISDEQRTDWHDQTLWMVREKRDKAASKVEDWEELRNVASSIKEHTLARLDEYLLEFEKNAFYDACPICGNYLHALQSGKELKIRSILLT